MLAHSSHREGKFSKDVIPTQEPASGLHPLTNTIDHAACRRRGGQRPHSPHAGQPRVGGRPAQGEDRRLSQDSERGAEAQGARRTAHQEARCESTQIAFGAPVRSTFTVRVASPRRTHLSDNHFNYVLQMQGPWLAPARKSHRQQLALPYKSSQL
eukprot:6194959-Pleurochrysis_carterae.AAC.2